MGNIIGDPFDKEVKKQVEVRQNKIGQITKDQNILSWANSKTAFLRLASSVNIDDELAKNFGDGMSGDQLARKCVLYNGITTTSKDAEGNITQNPMNGGIATPGENYSAFNNPYSYGYGGLEYGFRPMPGIVGAQVTFYNRGSLSSVSIQIKAFTPQQLNLIELLYMRVGFTILLEWGHTQYFDNNGEYQTQDTFITKPFQSLFSGKKTFNTILDEIRKERKLKSYNYDAFLGRIKNFNWTFNPDGTYDITISAISVGDIIESLNIHQNNKDKNNEIIDGNDDTEDYENITLKDGTVIKSREFDDSSVGTTASTGQSDILDIKFEENKRYEKSDLHRYLIGGKNEMFLFGDDNLPSYFLDEKKFDGANNTLEKAFVYIRFRNSKNTKTDDGNAVSLDEENGQVYIKLGLLLKYISNNLLLYNLEGANKKTPLVGVDYDPNTNFCLTFPQQLPTNPKVCVIPVSYVNEEAGIDWNYLREYLGDDFFGDNAYIGKLMHIHININYIMSIYENLYSDKTRKVPLLAFLQSLLDGVSSSLGAVNNFTVTYDKERNKIVIREDNNLRYNKIQKDFTKFNINGLRQAGTDINTQQPITEGSIVKDVNFNVTITPQFSQMVMAGAQREGNIVGEDATSLSLLYKGSEDRLLKLKKDKYTLDNPTLSKEPEKTFQVNLEAISDALYEMYSNRMVIEGNVESLPELYTPYSKYVKGFLSENKVTPAGGFLPFDLTLTLEGISGIKIYEKFQITDEILPSSYRTKNGKSKVDFLIRGVTHNIQDNKWDTQLSTLTVPSSTNLSVLKPRVFPKIREIATPGISYKEETTKIQIYIHHTVGRDSIQQVEKTFKDRFDNVSTPYIIDQAGTIKKLYDPKTEWSNHLGLDTHHFTDEGLTYRKLDKISIGIELTNWGYVVPEFGDFSDLGMSQAELNRRMQAQANNEDEEEFRAADEERFETKYRIPNIYSNKEKTEEIIFEGNVAQTVDKNGNVAPFKGYQYWEEYPDAQLQSLKKTFITINERI